jgi:hypothetical protein
VGDELDVILVCWRLVTFEAHDLLPAIAVVHLYDAPFSRIGDGSPRNTAGSLGSLFELT